MSEIRVLQVLGLLEVGGAESRIMDIYRNIDREKVQFDFMVHTQEEGFFEEEVKELGGRIYRVPKFRIYNYFAYKKAWREFFKEHPEIDIVQGHMTSTAAIYLPIAKSAGVRYTIAHARSAGVDPGLKGKMTKFLRRNLQEKADALWACSKEAGIAVYGKRAVEKGSVVMVPNAVDTDKFAKDMTVRQKMRQEYGIEDKFVVGHVGRFHYAKNHEFLLHVFQEFIKQYDADALGIELTEENELPKGTAKGQLLKKISPILLLVGGGEDAPFRELAKELGIEDSVIFAGRHNHIADFYQAMDMIIFPSRYEGMPGTVVEAQAAGLPCLISDKITRDVGVTELVQYMSLDRSYEAWARAALAMSKEYNCEAIQVLKEKGFDVKEQVKMLQNVYQDAAEDKSHKKKILLISPMLHQGGFEKVCLVTARMLQPAYQVYVLIFSDEDIVFDTTGVEIINLNIPAANGRVQKIWNLYRRIRGIQKLKKKLSIDIAYSFGKTANRASMLAKGERDIRLAACHSFAEINDKAYMRLIARHADKVMCCSKVMYEEAERLYTMKSIVPMWNPCDLDDIRKQAQEEMMEPSHKAFFEGEELVLVSMGREADVKGYWHMFKAFYLLWQKMPEVKLAIVGEGVFIEYQEMLKKWGIEDRVLFTGIQRNPFPYLKRAKAYLLTSLSEGLPNVLVEALALNVPIVSVNCKSGPAEILGENPKDYTDDTRVYQAEYGILAPAMGREKDLRPEVFEEEEKIFADCLFQLLEDGKLYQHYVEAAVKRAQDFSVEAYHKRLVEYMES